MKRDDKIGIVCPYCGRNSNGKIIDSRATINGKRRRRICEHCGQRFTTIESCAVRFRGYFNADNKAR